MRVLATLVALTACGARAGEAEKEDLPHEAPKSVDGAQFWEPFLETWAERWVISKDADFTGTWKHETYTHDGLKGDMGIVVGDQARKHAISTVFPEKIKASESGLVVQYELQLKSGLECGGAYLKLLTASEELSLEGFKGETPYTIMFGPDKCGDTNKVHFILRHKNALTGAIEEKHMVTPPVPQTNDKMTHLYTAVIGTDNKVRILVDNKEQKVADLLSDTDFKPAVNPPKTIDDPADSKPEEWIDEPKMDDPESSKPSEWDDDAPKQIADPSKSKPEQWLDDAPLKVPDASAVTPEDWDEDEDGEWEAPLVDNPECKAAGCGEWNAPMIMNPDYKGKWVPPKIDNPAYIGVWTPAQIDNPSYVLDETPYDVMPIGGIGIELWTMQNGILFDNILVAADAAVAAKVAEEIFEVRAAAEKRIKTAAKPLPGWLQKLNDFFSMIFEFMRDNLIAVGATFCLVVLPLLLYCCCGRSADAELAGDEDADADTLAAAAAAADAPAAADGGSAEGSASTSVDAADGADASEARVEEVEPEEVPEAPKRKPSTRKRVPKAS